MAIDLDEIRELLTAGQPRTEPAPKIGLSVITVRLPKALHKALLYIAHEQRMSLNKLCVEALWRDAWNQAHDLETELAEAEEGNPITHGQ